METMNPMDGVGASVTRGGSDAETITLKGSYAFTCTAEDGTERWKDVVLNMVVTLGKNDLLDKYLSGSGYTAAFYLGLISSAGWSAINANDTASSHAGWQEAATANAPTYSQANRPTMTFNAAASGNKSSNGSVTFSITANGTAKGAFLSTSSVKDGTGGLLFSAGLFSGGDKVLQVGDTLNGSYSLSV